MPRSLRLLWLALAAVAFVVALALGHDAVAGPPLQAQGPTLRVVTKTLKPFVFRQDGRLTGFSAELWERIAQEIGVSYQWIEVDSVSQQIDFVRTDRAEVAIAGISMTAAREQVVDFSHPMFNAGPQIMTRAEVDQSFTALVSALFSPGLLQILIVGLIILVLIAHFIWIFERFDGTSDGFPTGYRAGVWEGIWWAASLLATGGYGDKPANTLARRLVAMFWMFLGIILIAQFTASVTSNLTVQRLQGSINGPADLPGKRVATVAGSTSAQFLTAERINFTSVQKIEDAYVLLATNKVQAIVFDAPVLLYYAANAGKGTAQVVGQVFKPEEYAIALKVGSPYRKAINEALLKLKQDGTYQLLYDKWFKVGG